jgi:stress response protein YsnF
MEEVLVVEKRLMLREEVRLTTRRTETREQTPVQLRYEQVDIEREPGPAGEAHARGAAHTRIETHTRVETHARAEDHAR